MNLSEAFKLLSNDKKNSQKYHTEVVTHGSGVGFLPNEKHGIAIYLYDDKEITLVNGEVARWQPNIDDFTRDDWFVDLVPIKEESENI